MMVNPFAPPRPTFPLPNPNVDLPPETIRPEPEPANAGLDYSITTTRGGTTITVSNETGSIKLSMRELTEVMGKAGKHL